MILGDGFVYVDPPRTGSRSMSEWLKEHYGGREVGQHALEIPESHKDAFVFATIRNPYARAMSIWWHFFNPADPKTERARRELREAHDGERPDIEGMILWARALPMEEWAKRYYVIAQNTFLGMVGLPEFYIRTEHMEEDVRHLPFYEKASGAPGHLHMQAGATPGVEHRLHPEIRGVIRVWAGEDFELWSA